MVTVPLSTGQLTLTLPQLQALISSQLTQSKTTPPTHTASPSISSIQSAPPTQGPVTGKQSTTILAYPCTWGSCQEIFEDNIDLGSHIIKSNHIFCESDGYYCYWKGCPRTKEHNGKPFDTLQKITRHVKEVHMLRIVAQKVPVDQLGSNYHRRGLFLKDSSQVEATPTHQIAQQPGIVVPTPSLIPSGQSILSPDVATPSPTAVSSIVPSPVILPPSVIAPPTASSNPAAVTANVPSAPPPKPPDADTPPNVFVPPPKNMRQVVHSQIYLE